MLRVIIFLGERNFSQGLWYTERRLCNQQHHTPCYIKLPVKTCFPLPHTLALDLTDLKPYDGCHSNSEGVDAAPITPVQTL